MRFFEAEREFSASSPRPGFSPQRAAWRVLSFGRAARLTCKPSDEALDGPAPSRPHHGPAILGGSDMNLAEVKQIVDLIA
jgi:hypothetical protein